MDSTSHWNVALVSPNADFAFEKAVVALGLEALSVKTTATRKHRRNKSLITQTVPLFAGYVFVRVPDCKWSDLKTINGFVTVLRDRLRGELAPSRVSDEEVSTLRDLEQYGANHRVDLRTAVPFKAGELVDASFLGSWVRATVQQIKKDGRVLSTAEVHGRAVKLELPHNQYRKAA